MFSKKMTSLALLAVPFLIACGNESKTTSPSSSNQPVSSTSSSSAPQNRVIKESDTAYQTYTETIINARPEQVWATLTDFAQMPEWSSSFQGITGNLQDGEEVVVTYIFQGESVDYSHRLSYVANQEMSWSDPLPAFPWLTDDHHFKVEAYGNRQTRFIQTDTYTQLRDLSEDEITAQAVATAQLESYQVFNQELKTEVEKRNEDKK